MKLVGLQLWRGAFLLADFILANPDLFKDKIILELGSGVGLTSIIASSLAKKVICTGNQFKNSTLPKTILNTCKEKYFEFQLKKNLVLYFRVLIS